MGAWGTAIFSDDLASDVRGEYKTLLSLGKTNEEATNLIIEYFYNECKGTEDEPAFWFALSLSQWNTGRLLENVKHKALDFIESGVDLERWNSQENQKNYKKRLKVLNDLKEKLLSPMPKEKKISKAKLMKSPWKVGDLLAYKITNDNMKKSAVYNKYALLRVIQIDKSPISRIARDLAFDESVLVGLYGWIGDVMPQSDITESLKFIPFSINNDPVFGKEVHTCAKLSWEKNSFITGEVTVLGNDPSYLDQVPIFFDTRFNKYSWYGFGAMDAQLGITLKEYI